MLIHLYTLFIKFSLLSRIALIQVYLCKEDPWHHIAAESQLVTGEMLIYNDRLLLGQGISTEWSSQRHVTK